MGHLFSAKTKYVIWRKLWVALAKAQKGIGLPISQEQIEEMERSVDSIDFQQVAIYEAELVHDVMAHLKAYCDLCPQAKGIIHWGATSAYLTDNGDLIQIQLALDLLKTKCRALISKMSTLALRYSDLATLSYTHFQPAQPTTMGKRICSWLQDFLLDLQDLLYRQKHFRFLGVKGATGTQASFMTLLGDAKKVEELDLQVSLQMGMERSFIISGQTYTRKQDCQIFSLLEGIATSSHKCGTDLRLLAHLGELAEGRTTKQVGSSAMPHKRNPIHAERICGIARFLISLSQNGAYTHATQWLERSLDDSSNRRLAIPEAFLCADALFNLLIELFNNLEFFPEISRNHLKAHAEETALEKILMWGTKQGKDRQYLHEKLLNLAKNKGHLGSNWIDQVATDPEFSLSQEKLSELLEPDVGRAKLQVEKFLKEEVDPLLEVTRVKEN